MFEPTIKALQQAIVIYVIIFILEYLCIDLHQHILLIDTDLVFARIFLANSVRQTIYCNTLYHLEALI